jgi:Abortive infection alpha
MVDWRIGEAVGHGFMSDTEKAPFSVQIGAKAELKATIPAPSMGRLVDALTDAIRPFTEPRGLKADLIRLQREEVAIQIAHLAAQRARIEKIKLTPPPMKFLITFLEKASLEVDDTDLHLRWAALLLSASTSYQASHVAFIDILSRLSADELKLLEEVVLWEKGVDAAFSLRPFILHANNENIIRSKARMLDSTLKRSDPFEDFIKATLIDLGRITDGVVFFGEEASFRTTKYSQESAKRSMQLLERERLLNIRNISVSRKNKRSSPNIEIGYFEVTLLGVSFVHSSSPSFSKTSPASPADR